MALKGQAPPRNQLTGGGHPDYILMKSATNSTVYSAIGAAAGACSGNGILTGHVRPRESQTPRRRSDRIYDFGIPPYFTQCWNTKVLFTGRVGRRRQPRCRADRSDALGEAGRQSSPRTRAKYHSPVLQDAGAADRITRLRAHNGSLLPIPGRDIWCSHGIRAAFGGGFNDVRILSRSPSSSGTVVAPSGGWARAVVDYWYNGYIAWFRRLAQRRRRVLKAGTE